MISTSTLTKLSCLACVLTGLVLSGCAGPASEVGEPVSVAQASYDKAFAAAADVLREYQFRIDRIDRRRGVIETFPMTGRSWLEFWRKDGATLWDISESSLQTLYRRAVVTVVPGEADAYDVRVRVTVARADRPSPQVTNTSQAFGLFQLQRGRRRYQHAMGQRGVMDRKAVPLDDDLVLAMFIRRDIRAQMAD